MLHELGMGLKVYASTPCLVRGQLLYILVCLCWTCSLGRPSLRSWLTSSNEDFRVELGQ
jgi:hypothetical protein